MLVVALLDQLVQILQLGGAGQGQGAEEEEESVEGSHRVQEKTEVVRCIDY